jgi:hypothetical protein
LILYLLKVRQSTQQTDLELSSAKAWETISNHASKFHMAERNLLFGIYQDATPTKLALIAKDSNNQIVGTVLTPTLGRNRTIAIGSQTYTIRFPLTWNHTAILESSRGDILARYRKTGLLGEHEFEVPGYGVLKSGKPSFNFKARYDYNLNGKIIGSRQSLSSIKSKGRLIVLPSDLPLSVRVFILTV